jgi:hypothetical protein
MVCPGPQSTVSLGLSLRKAQQDHFQLLTILAVRNG